MNFNIAFKDPHEYRLIMDKSQIPFSLHFLFFFGRDIAALGDSRQSFVRPAGVNHRAGTGFLFSKGSLDPVEMSKNHRLC